MLVTPNNNSVKKKKKEWVKVEHTVRHTPPSCKRFRKNISRCVKDGCAFQRKRIRPSVRQNLRVCHLTQTAVTRRQTETSRNLVSEAQGMSTLGATPLGKTLAARRWDEHERKRETASRQIFCIQNGIDDGHHVDTLQPDEKSKTMAGYDCDMHRSLVVPGVREKKEPHFSSHAHKPCIAESPNPVRMWRQQLGPNAM